MTTGPIDFARKFHRDRRGQIMPLVFFLGIAFFTGVVLVVNTGRTVTGRIQAQNAVDAAVVSGTSALARGMNYISSNNISMAKILATIVILRAFPGAIDDARITLDVWDAVGKGMVIAGNALALVPFCAAAGAALVVAGQLIQAKVQQEKAVLQAVEPVVEGIANVWDNNGNGVGWVILKILAKLGDLLAYESPIIAQFTAKKVFESNLAPGENGDAWMLPLYPKMPACKGKFADFVDKVTHYAEKFSEPITIAAWLVLTLSLFPVWYMIHLKAEIKKLFTGAPSTTDPPPDDPDQARIRELQDQIDSRKARMRELDAHLTEVKEQIASVEAGDDPTVHPGLGTNLTDLRNEEFNTQLQIDALKAEIEERNDEITEISQRRTQSGSGQPDDFSNDIDDPLGGGTVQDNPDVYPYLIVGAGWPKTFTFFCLGHRDVPAPMTDRVFKKPMDTAYVYATARLVNSVEADLWTPAWHARLVRAQASLIPTNPVGTLPAACGQEGESGGMDVPGGGSAPPDGDQESGILQDLLGQLSKH
jgi:hypothetical protein